MFETGCNVTDATMPGIARPHTGNVHYSWKSLAAGGAVFMLALLAPISIDITVGDISINAVQAGNGDGNYGNGGGNGGPNGQIPGNRENRGKPGDDDADDDGPANNDDPTDGDGSNYVPEEPGSGTGVDESSDMADADAGDAIETATGSPEEGSKASAPVTTPTASQIFALGNESVISGEAELELIANGWKATN